MSGDNLDEDDWLDDFEDDEDDDGLDEFNAEVAHMEPVEQPEPRELLPEPGELPIESQRENRANVRLLMASISAAVRHRYENPVYGPVNEIDLLKALENMIRMFVLNTVLHRVKHPEAATCNRVAVLKMLEELNDEILKLDLPKPQVN